MSVCGHVGENVCLTVLLFDGLSVHPFVCSYTVLCMFLSVPLSTRTNIICICVRPSVCPSARLYAYFCVILFVTLLVCMFSFRSFVRPSVRPSVLSSSVKMIMHACKSVVYKHVRDIPFSNFLLLTSYF